MMEQAYIPAEILHRKGARKASEIPHHVNELLTLGQIQSVNLTEWLAVDHMKLLQHVLEELELQQLSQRWLQELEKTAGQPTMKVIPAIAAQWLEHLMEQDETKREVLFQRLSTHRSDSVRCWAAYIIGIQTTDIGPKLKSITPFAADHHFGVREIAWMAVRETASEQLEAAIELLESWVLESDANLRRFAIELTRPRGVWTKHIHALKEKPELALSLLEPVLADPEKYVQDSVSNWLNDAAKSQPDWVVQLCEAWLEKSDAPATVRIAKRAQRSIS